MASTSASAHVSRVRTAAASAVPAAMVSGSPIPSSRTGSPTSRRSKRRSMRDASVNSTSVSVASASTRTPSLWI